MRKIVVCNAVSLDGYYSGPTTPCSFGRSSYLGFKGYADRPPG